MLRRNACPINNSVTPFAGRTAMPFRSVSLGGYGAESGPAWDKAMKPTNNLADALNSLFAEIDPETPDEIDAIIRSVGIDPDTYAAEMARRVADTISKGPAACHWQLVNTAAKSRRWRAGCGVLWVFTDAGTPQEHNVKFCPNCGRAVKAAERGEQ